MTASHSLLLKMLGVALLWFPPHAFCASPGLKIRQVVVRAPMGAVAEAALANPGDEALAAVLWQWVREGTASVVSDVQGVLAGADQPVSVSSGKMVAWPEERDQDFDTLVLNPMRWQNTLVGTSMKVTPGEGNAPGPDKPTSVQWDASYSPREPLDVKWPVTWPQNKVPRVAWLSQPEFFQQRAATPVSLQKAGTTILGILPPGDSLEPGSPHVGFADVILAVVSPADRLASESTAAGGAPVVAPSRLLLLGIGVDRPHELDLLNRDSKNDAALLAHLLKLASTGQATLRTCVQTHLADGIGKLESARDHVFPTEMPTIPSAWENRSVGTLLETDYAFPGSFTLGFVQHPSLPHRAVWRCAVDAPEMVMWQPEFVTQTLRTNASLENGKVTLIGAMRTPDCVAGAVGLKAGETLLLFARLDEAVSMKRPLAAPAASFDPFAPSNVPQPRKMPYQAETIIFDLPASEKPEWQETWEGTDQKLGFDKLLKRASDGTAGIAAHLVLTTQLGQRSRVGMVQEVRHVTEGSPDYTEVPGRYRPTALEDCHTGTRWEVELTRGDGDQKKVILVRHELVHDTAFPEKPSLEEMISRSAATQHRELPPLKRFQEMWNDEVKVQSGEACYLGLRHPPGTAQKDRILICFVRVRMVD